MLEEFFEKKKRLYPQAAKGRFRRIKWILNSIFLAIYLFTPYLRFDRGPSSPNQAILIDLPNSRAYFFFIEIWPQEVYYLMGILIFAALILFFITSLFGRVWCGYACFQTVWTDIFIYLEKVFQGDRNQRIILDRKNNFEKFYKKTLTHLSWIIVALVTGYGFVAYFNDTFLLFKNLLAINLSYNILGWIIGIAAATYIMAGFAREHVCTYMCPYSRFQSAMFDLDTLIISYDEKRGEMRGKHKQGESFAGRGHCIDCKQCVVVCPQGIDIRNGLQMECIACGLCIDACDDVMTKIGLPKGLIRYDTERNLIDPTNHHEFKFFRPRAIFYAVIIFTVSFVMLYGLMNKGNLEINAIPDRNPLFVTLSDGSIRNGYTIKIANKTHQDKIFQLILNSPKEMQIKINSYEEINENNIPVSANSVFAFKIYATLPLEEINKISQNEILLDVSIADKDNNLDKKNVKAVFIVR